MLASPTVLVLVATLACPWSLHLSLWPPNLEGADPAELVTEERAFQELQLLEQERHRVITADVIVVGQVLSEECYQAEEGPVLTAFTIGVEDVLKGSVESEQIETSIMGGTLDGRTTAPSGVDYPELGERYVFCLREDHRWRPGAYRGGSSITRYRVVDGVVVRKGMTLEEFAESVQQQINVYTPAEQLSLADAVVVAVVQEVVNNAIPAPVSLSMARQEPNHAILKVSASLQGEIPDGADIRIELPPRLNSGHRIDSLSESAWVLAFLRRGDGDSWCFLDGASSVHTLEADSVQDALDSARTLVSRDGPTE
jgi:hypothetical protein